MGELQIFLGENQSSQIQLKLHNPVAKLSVEDGIFLLDLGLFEHVLNHSADHVLVDVLVGELVLFLDVINSLGKALVLGFESLEHVASEFIQLLLEVVGTDDVEDQSDLLLVLLVPLELILDFLRLLLQLYLLLVVLHFPREWFLRSPLSDFLPHREIVASIVAASSSLVISSLVITLVLFLVASQDVHE